MGLVGDPDAVLGDGVAALTELLDLLVGADHDAEQVAAERFGEGDVRGGLAEDARHVVTVGGQGHVAGHHREFEAGPVHPLDIARFVEADVEHGLLGRPRHVEGELLGLARQIIPVALVELADEGRPAQRSGHRFAIVDAGLDRRHQSLVEHVALMVADRGAAAQRGRAKHGRKREAGSLPEAHLGRFS